MKVLCVTQSRCRFKVTPESGDTFVLPITRDNNQTRVCSFAVSFLCRPSARITMCGKLALVFLPLSYFHHWLYYHT